MGFSVLCGSLGILVLCQPCLANESVADEVSWIQTSADTKIASALVRQRKRLDEEVAAKQKLQRGQFARVEEEMKQQLSKLAKKSVKLTEKSASQTASRLHLMDEWTQEYERGDVPLQNKDPESAYLAASLQFDGWNQTVYGYLSSGHTGDGTTDISNMKLVHMSCPEGEGRPGHFSVGNYWDAEYEVNVAPGFHIFLGPPYASGFGVAFSQRAGPSHYGHLSCLNDDLTFDGSRQINMNGLSLTSSDTKAAATLARQRERLDKEVTTKHQPGREQLERLDQEMKQRLLMLAEKSVKLAEKSVSQTASRDPPEPTAEWTEVYQRMDVPQRVKEPELWYLAVPPFEFDGYVQIVYSFLSSPHTGDGTAGPHNEVLVRLTCPEGRPGHVSVQAYWDAEYEADQAPMYNLWIGPPYANSKGVAFTQRAGPSHFGHISCLYRNDGVSDGQGPTWWGNDGIAPPVLYGGH